MPLYYPTSQNAVQKTLGAALNAGVTAAATLNNVTGIQNKAGVLVVDRVDTNGTETPNKREYIGFAGTSGSTVVALTRNIDGGGTDQDHAIGAIVEFIPDVVWAEAINTALANMVDTTTLAVDTTKVVTPNGAQTLSSKIISGATLTGVVDNGPVLNVGGDVTGDMYYRASGPSLSRLAKGTFGQILAMNSTLPAWSSAGAFSPFVDITDASTMYVDFSLGNKFKATIVPSGARTFAATNATVGSVAMLRVQYASTASLGLNLFTVNSTISWGASLPVATGILGQADVFGFSCISTLPKFDGFVLKQGIL